MKQIGMILLLSNIFYSAQIHTSQNKAKNNVTQSHHINQELIQEIEALSGENEKMFQTIQRLNQKIDALNEEIKTKNETIDDLNEDLEAKKFQISLLTKKNKLLESIQKETSDAQLETLKQRLSQEKEENETLLKTVNTLKEIISKHEKSIKELTEKLETSAFSRVASDSVIKDNPKDPNANTRPNSPVKRTDSFKTIPPVIQQ